jgi:mannose-1-phosphate guanylyltransferase
VPTDGEGRVTGFVEKSENPVTDQVNAGCYVFRRRVIDEIPPGQVVSVERETFPQLVDRGALVVGYVETAYWRDVGTPEALVAASRDLVLGTATSPAVPAAPAEAWVDGAATTAGSATLTGGSTLTAGATVGEGARVSGSVLMPGAVVSRVAEVVDSVLGPGSVVGPAARLVSVTLGDGARVEPGGSPAPGTRVDCDGVVSASRG